SDHRLRSFECAVRKECRHCVLHRNPSTSPNELNTTLTPHSIIHGHACFAYLNKIWHIPGALNELVIANVRSALLERHGGNRHIASARPGLPARIGRVP